MIAVPLEVLGHARVSGGERILRGLAASPGIAIGAAALRSVFPHALPAQGAAHRDADLERGRLSDAREQTRSELSRLHSCATTQVGEERALIFVAQSLMLDDPTLTRLVEQGIAGGSSAALAVECAFDHMLARLRCVTIAYIHERIDDLEDLRTRMLDHLLERPRTRNIDARVVISERTMPSLVVSLDAAGALGIASELGGTLSHGVVLARALHLPAVTGVAGLTQAVCEGDVVVVDGDAGCVMVRPSPSTIAELGRRRARSTPFA